MTETTIEWTDLTWNPVRGCTKVSAGCKHCYAETFAERFRGVPGHPFEQGFDLRLVPDKLDEPFRWKQPKKVFVNSMSDLFHEDIPDDYVAQVFASMALTQAHGHTYQALTKRPERMRALLTSESFRSAVAAHVARRGGGEVRWPLSNVWLGTSVEHQEAADERIPVLLEVPAALRFLSCEPLLGAVDLKLPPRGASSRIEWIIIGGESGPKARPFELAWPRGLLTQAREAGVAAFMKQLGAKPMSSAAAESGEAPARLRLKNRKGGDPAEWPEDLRVRQFPERR